MFSAGLAAVLFTITLGTSFNYGFHIGVMNQPLEMIEIFIANVTAKRGTIHDEGFITTLGSFCVTAMVIGGTVGAGFGGLIANKMGRKWSVVLLFVPLTIGCVLMMICKAVESFEVIIAGRAIAGFSCGAYTAIGPLYLAEVAPPSIRGAAGVLNQLVATVSIVISQILGLRFLMGTEELWPYLISFSVFPSFVATVCLLFCPESPRYLFLIKSNRSAPESALRRLGNDEQEVMKELKIMAKESEAQSRKTTLATILRTPHLRLAFCVAIVSQLGNQLAANNGLMFYSVKLLSSCGIQGDNAQYINIGFGTTQVVSAVISAIIIDRVGRRRLFLGGLIALVTLLVLFTGSSLGKDLGGVRWLAYASVVIIFIFNFFYNIGPGSIPWFLPAELFTQENRDVVASAAAITSFLCNIIIALGFVQLVAYIPDYSFVPSIVVVLLSVIYLWIYLPETRGRNPQAIEEEFKRMTGWKRELVDEEASEQSHNEIWSENLSVGSSTADEENLKNSVETTPDEEKQGSK